jgi:hypothetical protein
MRATMVPTLVPMLRDMTAAARKRPGNTMLAGRMESVRFTTSLTLPISLADEEKVPARMNIHYIFS